MSSFYDDASLVVIPSGYKTSKIYAEKPTDGSGDLSFSRASNGTRINSAGLVEVCPWNLLQYSEDFGNGVWGTTGITITTNTTTAPNGTTTADTADITVNGGHYLLQSFGCVPNQQYTFSFYVKRGTATDLYYSVFDNSNGGNIIAPSSYYSQTSSTNWSRISVSFTTPNNCTAISVYPLQDTPVIGTVYLWGAQLNIGSTAKPYFPTTDRLNVPRLTYQNGGGGCPSLLLEKQSTNILTYSEDFTNAAWSKLDSGSGSTTPIVTANYAISPDGTQNASRLQCTLGSSGYSLIQQTQAASGTHTGSIWVKSNTGANQNIYFRISTNTTAFVVTPQWQRITITEANGDYLTIGLRDQTGYTNYSCDILIWGAQLEASSYPTSYIPTTSSSATRVADACFKTGISSLIGQTEGTIFLDVRAVLDTTTNQDYSVSDGTTSNRALIRLNNSGLINAIGVFGGSVEFNMGTTAYTTGSRYKIALAYKLNDIALYVNGVQAATDNTATISGTLSRFGFDVGTGVAPVISPVNQALLFKTRLTNAQLAELTTL